MAAAARRRDTAPPADQLLHRVRRAWSAGRQAAGVGNPRGRDGGVTRRRSPRATPRWAFISHTKTTMYATALTSKIAAPAALRQTVGNRPGVHSRDVGKRISRDVIDSWLNSHPGTAIFLDTRKRGDRTLHWIRVTVGVCCSLTRGLQGQGERRILRLGASPPTVPRAASPLASRSHALGRRTQPVESGKAVCTKNE